MMKFLEHQVIEKISILESSESKKIILHKRYEEIKSFNKRKNSTELKSI